jgi:hypothetical protein
VNGAVSGTLILKPDSIIENSISSPEVTHTLNGSLGSLVSVILNVTLAQLPLVEAEVDLGQVSFDADEEEESDIFAQGDERGVDTRVERRVGTPSPILREIPPGTQPRSISQSQSSIHSPCRA